MIDPAHDEQIARLQRLVYGADTPAVERAEAEEALRALVDNASAVSAASETTEASPAAEARSEPHRVFGDLDAGGPAPIPSAREFRWAIVAGGMALLVGVGLGWQLGTRLVPDVVMPTMEPDAIVFGPELLAEPISGSAAIEVFDRPQVDGDVPAAEAIRELPGTSSYRLLVTRSDGVTLHASRAENGVDVCITVVVPDFELSIAGETTAAFGRACTTDGSFPGEGLTHEVYMEGRGLLRAGWNSDGTALISAPAPR